MLRTIALAFAVVVLAGYVTSASAAEKTKAAKAAVVEAKDGDACVPFNDAALPNPKGGSVQPRLRRGYEAWRTLEPGTKTVGFANGELPVTSTQYCDPKSRVYVTVSGFPGVFTRGSEFEYCTCSNPASVRLVPDLKYDRKSHILCNGELKCPPRPPPKK